MKNITDLAAGTAAEHLVAAIQLEAAEAEFYGVADLV